MTWIIITVVEVAAIVLTNLAAYEKTKKGG